MPKAFRRILKSRASGLYYDGRGGWTSNHADAFDYKSALNAIQISRTIRNERLFLILKFDDGRLDLTHTIPALRSSP